MNEIRLSISQINKMKHAIGFRTPKKGVHVASRNWYISSLDNDWEELVNLGFAKKHESLFYPDGQLYYLSKEGAECLGEILDTNIKI